MKHTYPLDLNAFDNWAVSKGHHDPKVFCDAIQAEWGMKADPQNVKHRWGRVVPSRDSFFGVVPCPALVYADGPGRGVFPLTEVQC